MAKRGIRRNRKKTVQHNTALESRMPTPVEAILENPNQSTNATGQTRRPTMVSASRAEMSSYSGPVPPPAIAQGWDAIVPGAANRMLTMAENQSNHRISIEAKVVESNITNEKRGQNYAFVLAVLVIVGAFYLLATNHDITGFGTLLTGVGSLVTLFVVGKKQGQKELDEKKEKVKNKRLRK